MSEKAYTGSFARIYDEIMGAVPYKLWYNYLQELLNYYQVKPETVLDLACGTGNMSIKFARDNYLVTGVDVSYDMLEQARKKTKDLFNVNFVQADLRNFQLEQKYQMAFSLFDSLNYILELEELKKVFANVYNHLEDDGIFIFDMNTPLRLMSIDPGTTMFQGKEYTCFWEDIIDKIKKRWQVRLKIYFNDRAKPFVEFHEETGYAVEEIKNLLYTVGFKYIDIYNAYTFEEGRDNNNRLYYVVFKKNISSSGNIIKKTGQKLKWTLRKPFLN